MSDTTEGLTDDITAVNPSSSEPSNKRVGRDATQAANPEQVAGRGSVQVTAGPQPWAPGFAPAEFVQPDNAAVARGMTARTGLGNSLSPRTDTGYTEDSRIITTFPDGKKENLSPAKWGSVGWNQNEQEETES
jgi:hypothetical protein